MLGTNVGFVWPPHVQQCPTMPNNVGICWDKCWHRLARALGYKLLLSHISFKPIVLKMISYLIAAYTLCGDVEPPLLANTVFEEDN